LGRATVLPQSKVKRLSAAIDGTADFDPKPTSEAGAGSAYCCGKSNALPKCGLTFWR
jgi:hypothetical protein